jgi:hypothetical protein
MTQQHRPIGYWLKTLDRAIEERFARDLAADSLTRRHWQVFNSLADGPMDEAAVRDGLSPFWDDVEQWPALRAEVVDRGWVVATGSQLSLTDSGRELHRRVFARVKETRQHLLDGIDQQEYFETMRVLEAMTTNAGA